MIHTLPTKKTLAAGWLSALILIGLNLVMVFTVPFKAPKIDQVHLPNSPIDAQIRIDFSEPMDRQITQNSFNINPQIEGKFSWTGKTMVFTPNRNLNYEQEYNIKIGSQAISLRGKNLSQNFEQKFTTSKPSFFYISTAPDSYGELMLFSLSDNSATALTDNKKMLVQNFDYDPIAQLIVLLTDKGIKIFDVNQHDISDLNRFNDDNYIINRVKWLPFENTLLISRTKVFLDKNVKAPSMDASDTELISYNFDNGETNQIKTGFTLQYEFYPTPDGTNIMIIDDNGNLVLKSLKTGKEELISTEFLEQYGFSEYGGYLLYTITPPNDFPGLRSNLIIQDQDGKKNSLFEKSYGTVDDPAISPDENFVTYKYSDEDEFIDYKRHYRLGLSNLEKQDHQVLTEQQDPSIDDPEFSPDGKILSLIKISPSTLDSEQEAGWNINSQKLIGGQIGLYNIATKQFSFPPIAGCDIKWISTTSL